MLRAEAAVNIRRVGVALGLLHAGVYNEPSLTCMTTAWQHD
jgi:hypothetical protein